MDNSKKQDVLELFLSQSEAVDGQYQGHQTVLHIGQIEMVNCTINYNNSPPPQERPKLSVVHSVDASPTDVSLLEHYITQLARAESRSSSLAVERLKKKWEVLLCGTLGIERLTEVKPDDVELAKAWCEHKLRQMSPVGN